MSLEPRYEARGTILIDELDEVSEITFVTKGHCVIGFDFNKEKKYCHKYTDNIIIGAFNVTFQQRASFLYTCTSNIYGYFIRKKNWLEMLDEFDTLAQCIKRNILSEYFLKLKIKVVVAKNK